MAAEAQSSSLTLKFVGLKSDKGGIRILIAASPEAYADKAAPAALVTIAAKLDGPTTTVNGLAPGHYAVKAFHDLNSDGQLNFNAMGIPKEPIAFSNNARAMVGPPAWRDVVFDLKPGKNALVMKID